MDNRLLHMVRKHQLCVFPVEPGRKKPLITGWQEKATTDEEQIRKWAEQFPGANWGIATGKSGLIVLDVDVKTDKDGWSHLRKWLEDNKEELPYTLQVTTPTGGSHCFFKGSGGNRAGFVKGCDLRSVGGYVVAPFSKIGEKEYQCDSPDLPILEAPEWLTRFAQATAGEKKLERAPITELDLPENIARAAAWLDTAPPAIEGSSGDHVTFATACRVRDFGVSEETCHGMMMHHWNPRCSPPWGPEELYLKVQNAYRYSRDRAGNASQDGQNKEAAGMFEEVKLEAITRPYRDIGLAYPERHWIVDGWIPMGGTCPTLFAGDGGTGKSQLALQLGYAVAAGQLWLGMETRQMPVLNVSCEDDDDEIDRRLYACRQHDPFQASQDRPFWSMCRVGKASVLAIGEGGQVRPGPFYAVLDKALEEMGDEPKLLVLDTAADMFAGDENNRQEVNAFVKVGLNSLGQRHNATIVILSHPSKAVGSTFSGSTAWNNAVRNRLFLKYHDPKKKTSYRVLSNEKANYSAAGGEILLQYDRGIYVPVRQTELRSIIATEILEAIREGEETGNLWSFHKTSPRYIGNACIFGTHGEGASEADIRDAVLALIKEGAIHNRTGKSRGNGLVGAGDNKYTKPKEPSDDEIIEREEEGEEKSWME